MLALALDLKQPTIQDRDWIQPILYKSGCISSDCTFGSLFIWSDSYNTKVGKYKNSLIRAYGKGEYCFPIGNDSIEDSICAMINDAKQRGFTFKLSGISKEQMEQVKSTMPGIFNFNEDRSIADYIYNSFDLINLSGKKYHNQRNQISQFKRSYSWSYEDITPENIIDCMDIEEEWIKQNISTHDSRINGELIAIEKAVRFYKELNLTGGIIKVNNKPIAFTLGEEINNDAFLVHFEKALAPYVGAYKVINQEFSANRLYNYKYVNREEDLGIEGLRKAKLSYHPSILMNKYSATLR